MPAILVASVFLTRDAGVSTPHPVTSCWDPYAEVSLLTLTTRVEVLMGRELVLGWQGCLALHPE